MTNIKITQWSPDTCQCVLQYEWDADLPQENRTHTVYNIIRKCPAHENLANNQSVFNAVIDENPRKNIARQLLLDNAPSSLYDIIDTENGTKEFKKGISFSWSWTGTAPNRKLNIIVIGITLTTNQKNVIQNRLNTQFGTGNVVLINNN